MYKALNFALAIIVYWDIFLPPTLVTAGDSKKFYSFIANKFWMEVFFVFYRRNLRNFDPGEQHPVFAAESVLYVGSFIGTVQKLVATTVRSNGYSMAINVFNYIWEVAIRTTGHRRDPFYRKVLRCCWINDDIAQAQPVRKLDMLA